MGIHEKGRGRPPTHEWNNHRDGGVGKLIKTENAEADDEYCVGDGYGNQKTHARGMWVGWGRTRTRRSRGTCERLAFLPETSSFS